MGSYTRKLEGFAHAAAAYEAWMTREPSDDDMREPDVVDCLHAAADATPYLDVSTLIEALTDAAGLASDIGPGECIQALWAWEELAGADVVLATLRKLAAEEK